MNIRDELGRIIEQCPENVSRNRVMESGKSLDQYAVSSSFPELADKISFSHEDYVKCAMLDAMLMRLEHKYDTIAIILSGKREDELNKLVGGVEDSAHTFVGTKAAVDFTMTLNKEIDMRDVFLYARVHLIYGELIYYVRSNFIHMTLPFECNFMQSIVKS